MEWRNRSLETEIEEYKLELKDATSGENKLVWAGLIKSSRDCLTELLGLKKIAESAAVDDVGRLTNDFGGMNRTVFDEED